MVLYFVSNYVINRTIPFSCADIKNINSRDRVNIIIWNDKQNNYMFLLSKSKIYRLAEIRHHLAFARHSYLNDFHFRMHLGNISVQK